MNPEHLDNDGELDLHVDAALRGDRPRMVPQGFHVRLRRRIHIAVMLQKERRVFRRRMMRICGMGALATAAVTALSLQWEISQSFLWDSPGLMGKIDYLTVATNRLWLVSGNPALLLSVGVIGATALLAGTFVGIFREPVRR